VLTHFFWKNHNPASVPLQGSHLGLASGASHLGRIVTDGLTN
jgi:hypothetical protein